MPERRPREPLRAGRGSIIARERGRCFGSGADALMTLALVLGGGVAGIARETGLLKGLRDAGGDLTGADLRVGTSAGPVVGAQLADGSDLDTLSAN